VFSRVSAVLTSGADPGVLVSFEYYWVDAQGNRSPEILHANVKASRRGGQWRIDEEQTKHFLPSWPVLPSRQLLYAIEK
jgi:hypothetical protein